MAKSPKKKQEPEATPPSSRAHLIRIADTPARLRAIMVLGEVRVPYCGFTDYQMLVTNEHLDALRREAIPLSSCRSGPRQWRNESRDSAPSVVKLSLATPFPN